MHLWHEKNNAVFVDAGLWLRPRYYNNIMKIYLKRQNERPTMSEIMWEYVMLPRLGK